MKRLATVVASALLFSLVFQGATKAQLVNLALDKPVTASPQLNASFPATNANDGDTSPSAIYHSATSVTEPFWEVDLEGDFDIQQVNLYNRADGSGNFGNRLNNIFVQVLDEFDNEVFTSDIFNEWDGTGLVSEIFNPGAGPHEFDTLGSTGRKVRVFKESQPGSPWLALAEVEVLVDSSSLTSLMVDRITGAMTLSHSASAQSNLDFLGYSITSDLGALDASNWKSIAENYDADSGDMSADGDDTWTILSDPADLTDLSEFQFIGTANDGVSLAPGESIVLSEGSGGAGAAWIATNDENDLRMELALPGGLSFDVPVSYANNGGEALSRSDFDGNGVIDAADYLTIEGNFPDSTLSGASAALQHRQGDTDFDGDVDIDDFFNFRSDYEASFGAGSFAALVKSAQVPEPSSVILMVMTGIVFCVRRTRVVAACMLLALTCCATAHADTLGWWRLGDDDFDPFLDDIVFQSDINTGTFGNMTPPITSSEPLYSDLVPGATIIDGLNGDAKYLNEWSIASQRDEIAPQDLGTTDQTIPGAFTYETFVRFADTSVSRGVDFGRQWSGDTGFLMQMHPATSGSANFETLSVSVRADDGGTASNLGLASTTQLVDGQWYHVALVFEGNSADESNDIHLFVDGQLEDSANVADTATFGGDLAPVLVGEVVSDGTVNVDEVRYLDEPLALDGSEFLRVGTLRAAISPSEGTVVLVNDTLQAIDLSSYQIDSPTGRLLTDDANWDSLSDNNTDSIGSGTGESWDEGGASDANSIGEVFWLGSTILAPGESLDLGTPYNPGPADQELAVTYYDRALGKNISAHIDYDITVLFGDFNGDGVVNLADYTVWRDNLGGSDTQLNGNGNNNGASAGVVDLADYDFWKSNFGATAGAGALTGFQQSAVPEPASYVLALLAACGLTASRLRRLQRCRAYAGLVAALFLVVGFSGDAAAAVSNQRLYSMGDNLSENGADQGPVGSILGADRDVLDDSTSQVDLQQAGAAVYHQITGADVTAGHPGSVGDFSIAFDGTDDLLFHETLVNNVGMGASQGMQMWVYPDSAALGTASQAIVFDGSNTGGPSINADGMWSQFNSGHNADNPIPATVPVVGDTWHHVAQHIYLASDIASPDVVPGTGGALGFTSVIYVNGIAVSANNDGSGDPVGEFMIGAAGTSAEPTDVFSGVIDDVQVYTSAADGFDFLADNDYIAAEIAALPGGLLKDGDITLDGDVDGDDIDALIAGWRNEKVLPSSHSDMYVGDWETRGWGDLNLDGRVDLFDAYELHVGLIASGAGGLDIQFFASLQQVPEPSTSLLVGGCIMLGVIRQLRGSRSI